MILLFGVIALLLMQIPLSSLQAPVRTPSFSTVIPEGKEITPTSVRAERIPKDLDIEKTSLKELIDMRTKHMTEVEAQRFRNYFAAHPQIRRINLHDPATANTAKEFLALTSDWPLGRGSKNKLATSIRDLIVGTFASDPEHHQALTEAISGARFRDTGHKVHKMYTDKLTKGEKARKKIEAEQRFKQKTGYGYGKARKLAKQDPVLNKPLSSHLDKIGFSLTPQQAERKARELSHLYSSDLLLTRELDRYLRENDISPEERNAVIGTRQRHNKYTARLEKSRLQREAKRPSQSRSTSVEIGHGSQMSVYVGGAPSTTSHPSAASVQPPPPSPLTPSRQHEAFLVDPQDDKQWDWLHEVMQS